jgi:hypothetical protein
MMEGKIPAIQSKASQRRSATGIIICVVLIVAVFFGFQPGPIGGEAGLEFRHAVSIDGGSGGDDWALGMAYDSNHSILYATGFISVPDRGKDGVIWKLNSTMFSLEQIGNTTFGGPVGDDVGYALALDGGGHLFAAGYVSEASEDHNIWIARYDLNLTLERYITIDGPSKGTDEGYGLLLDNSGAVYIAGTITVPLQGYDIFIGKYDFDLNLQRNITIDGPASKTDKGRFLLLDAEGNLFVSGSMSQVGTGYDIWLGKFDTDLQLLDQKVIAGPTSGEDKGYGICLDDAGYLYATGAMTESGQGFNSWLAKFDKNLNLLSNITVNGPANDDDSAYSIVLWAGLIVQVGTYSELSGGANIMVALYNTNLHLISRITKNGSANGFDTAFGAIYVTYGIVFVSGFITEISKSQNAWIARFLIWIPV